MTAHVAQLQRPLFSRIREQTRMVLDIFAEASTGLACAREAERLYRLSDEDLARQGLTREDIIQHAFAPMVTN